MTSGRAAALALCLAALACPRQARADDNHYQNYLLGDRAAGLGGAFSAISDDASGAYYNPAGLAEAPHSSVSLSAAVYGNAGRSIKVSKFDFESDNNSFISYPTTAAWIQRLRRGDEHGAGRVQLAVSLMSPSSDAARLKIVTRNDPQRVGQTNTAAVVETVGVRITEEDTLWVGLSLAWKVLRRLSLGASVFLTYRTGVYQDQEVVLTSLYNITTQAQTGAYGLALWRDIRLTHLALVGMLGVVVPVTDHLRLGVTFRSPSVRLHGVADLKYFGTLDAQAGALTPSTLDLSDVPFNHRLPFKATVGAAYLVYRHWGVSLDFTIHGPVAEHNIFELESPSALEWEAFGRMWMKKKVVWQLNVGAEYYIAQIVPIRLGFFTNLSSLATMDDCEAGVCNEHKNMFTSDVDMFGVSGSVGFELEQVALNLGCSYSTGSSSSQVSGANSSGQVDLGRSYLLVAIGGAFRF